MGRTAIRIAGIAAALVAQPAAASFHLWEVSEVYTNADGSVQFVEFFTTFAGQEFLLGRELQALTQGVPEMTYTFPSNLPVGLGDSTAGHHFLFASPGFQAVSGIAPDYEWTGALSFINVGGNDALQLISADGFILADEISLASLPTDGTLSLLGDAVTTAVPTPTNFAGEIGTLPEPGACARGAGVLGALCAVTRSRRATARRAGRARAQPSRHR